MELKKRFFAAPVKPCKMVEHTPAPYFRYKFENNGLISSKLAISGLGFYRLFINGKEITKGLLSPYISNLDHIIYYDVYDLAPYLTSGANCVGVMLGNGMRNPIGAYVWSFQEGEFTGVPCFALEFLGENEKGEKSHLPPQILNMHRRPPCSTIYEQANGTTQGRKLKIGRNLILTILHGNP